LAVSHQKILAREEEWLGRFSGKERCRERSARSPHYADVQKQYFVL
jgi:hypothetical protein